jgi:type II secretion system protein J
MTLMEVMAAVAIMGLLGALTYGSISFSLQSQERSRRLHERYHAARLTLERMKKELSMAFVSLHQHEDKRTVTLFEGDRSKLIFNSLSHQPIQKNTGQSDQVEIEYRLDSVDGEDVIIRRIKHHVDGSPGKGGNEEIVVTGVDDLRFEYYDQDKESWRDDWDVRVDDATEMRTALKLVREQGDAIKGQVDAAAGDANPIASVVGEAIVDKKMDEAQGLLLDDVYLPPRVRIRLVLEDDNDRQYLLETQAEITMFEPLWY